MTINRYDQKKYQHNHKQNKRKLSQQLGKIAASWLIVQTLLLATPAAINAQEQEDVSYGELMEKIKAKEVNEVEIDPRTNKAKITLKPRNPHRS